jgi:hypothetical protein
MLINLEARSVKLIVNYCREATNQAAGGPSWQGGKS